jgi:GNAT superfamily N-acetyltransferase
MDNTLLSILNSNPTKNIAILGFFSSYPVKDYYVEGNSVFVLGKSDNLWAHISSSSETELSSILSKYHEKTKYYFSVEDWMIPLILNHGTEDWRMITDRYTLEESIITDLPKFDIIEIDKSYADFIYNTSDYKDYISIEYIEDRLSKDISAGILVNDILVAWGFTHDDGALGFLHVLDDFRNKGYGLDILLGLIQMRKKEKKPIFGNIVPGNVASTNLLTKLGFKPDCRTSWIKLK